MLSFRENNIPARHVRFRSGFARVFFEHAYFAVRNRSETLRLANPTNRPSIALLARHAAAMLSLGLISASYAQMSSSDDTVTADDATNTALRLGYGGRTPASTIQAVKTPAKAGLEQIPAHSMLDSFLDDAKTRLRITKINARAKERLDIANHSLEWSMRGQHTGWLYFTSGWAFAPCSKNDLQTLDAADLSAEFACSGESDQIRALFDPDNKAKSEAETYSNSIPVRENQIILAKRTDTPNIIYALRLLNQVCEIGKEQVSAEYLTIPLDAEATKVSEPATANSKQDRATPAPPTLTNAVKPRASSIKFKINEKLENFSATSNSKCHGVVHKYSFLPEIAIGQDLAGKEAIMRFYLITMKRNSQKQKYEPIACKVKEISVHEADAAPDPATHKYMAWKCSCCRSLKDDEFVGWYAELVADNKILYKTQSSTDSRVATALRNLEKINE